MPVVGRDDKLLRPRRRQLARGWLIARLRAAGLEGAELRTLFAGPRLSDFAATIQRSASPSAAASLACDHANRHDPFPLTEVQRAYWLGRREAFTLGGVSCNWYWEFDGGEVDLARLEEALNRVVQRHEMLRAVIDEEGQQRILPVVPRVHHCSPRRRPPVTRAPRSRSCGPPLERVVDPRDGRCSTSGPCGTGAATRLGFSFDYIVLDALSIVTVFSELAALYRDLDAALPPIGVRSATTSSTRAAICRS